MVMEELERISKEAVIVQASCLPSICLAGLENHKTLIMTGDVWADTNRVPPEYTVKLFKTSPLRKFPA